MFENPGGDHGPPAPCCRRPWVWPKKREFKVDVHCLYEFRVV